MTRRIAVFPRHSVQLLFVSKSSKRERKIWAPRVQKFVDDRCSEVLNIRRNDFAVHAAGHRFQELFESRMTSQSEKRDLSVEASDSVEFGH